MAASAYSLPRYFCWTKFGSEAGQSVEQILRRKEEERQRNDGVFMWGIGNSLGHAIHELASRSSRPEILFSPIKATPRSCDCDPEEVLAWRSAETVRGEQFDLPTWSLVTSRQDPARPKVAHYALVCYSDQPLEIIEHGPLLDFACLRNLATGNRLGASQVTAVVERRDDPISPRRPYPVAFRAALISPFFVRLRNPLPIPANRGNDWADAVAELWSSITDTARARQRQSKRTT